MLSLCSAVVLCVAVVVVGWGCLLFIVVIVVTVMVVVVVVAVVIFVIAFATVYWPIGFLTQRLDWRCTAPPFHPLTKS